MTSRKKPVKPVFVALVVLLGTVPFVRAQAGSGGGSNSHGPNSNGLRGDAAEAMYSSAAAEATPLPNGDWITLAKPYADTNSDIDFSDAWTCVYTTKQGGFNSSLSDYYCVPGDRREDIYARASRR